MAQVVRCNMLLEWEVWGQIPNWSILPHVASATCHCCKLGTCENKLWRCTQKGSLL